MNYHQCSSVICNNGNTQAQRFQCALEVYHKCYRPAVYVGINRAIPSAVPRSSPPLGDECFPVVWRPEVFSALHVLTSAVTNAQSINVTFHSNERQHSKCSPPHDCISLMIVNCWKRDACKCCSDIAVVHALCCMLHSHDNVPFGQPYILLFWSIQVSIWWISLNPNTCESTKKDYTLKNAKHSRGRRSKHSVIRAWAESPASVMTSLSVRCCLVPAWELQLDISIQGHPRWTQVSLQDGGMAAWWSLDSATNDRRGSKKWG